MEKKKKLYIILSIVLAIIIIASGYYYFFLRKSAGLTEQEKLNILKELSDSSQIQFDSQHKERIVDELAKQSQGTQVDNLSDEQKMNILQSLSQ